MKGAGTNGMGQKGVLFALAAAVVSGLSIYVSKFSTTQVSDPLILTAGRNITVALLLLALLILPRALPELKRLSRKQWLALIALGGIGGSLPFLLFFYGLSTATAASAAFMHKTLFVWIAVAGFLFLKERPTALQGGALALLVLGNMVILNWPHSWAFGSAEMFILAATLLWAIEAILARRVLRGISSSVGAFGRMCFGALFMLAFLGATGKLGAMAAFNGQQIFWIVVPSVLLFGYVLSYYAALKHAAASVVASILVLGSPITSLLYVTMDAKRYTGVELTGLAVTAAAVALLLYASKWNRPPRLASDEVKA